MNTTEDMLKALESDGDAEPFLDKRDSLIEQIDGLTADLNETAGTSADELSTSEMSELIGETEKIAARCKELENKIKTVLEAQKDETGAAIKLSQDRQAVAGYVKY